MCYLKTGNYVAAVIINVFFKFFFTHIENPILQSRHFNLNLLSVKESIKLSPLFIVDSDVL